jgi:hypothetical protein
MDDLNPIILGDLLALLFSLADEMVSSGVFKIPSHFFYKNDLVCYFFLNYVSA